MAEHIVRRVREQRSGAPRQAVVTAAAEFTRPLAGSSAATIIIFAPLAFLSGVTGAFFQALSLTMAASLVISFFVAWIALPIISTRLLTRRDADLNDGGKLTRSIHRVYQSWMGSLLRAPILI